MTTHSMFAVLFAFLWTCAFLCDASSDINRFYSDLQDQPNPPWFTLKQLLDLGENSVGPAYGSTIQVHHEEVNVGRYAYRKISRPIGLHSITHSMMLRDAFGNMTRWYQEDRNTQVFRLLPGDDNVRNERNNAPRSEAFGVVSWLRGDVWYEWSGRYTFLKLRPGAVLQIKHNSTYWSMQLIVDEHDDGTFDLSYVKLRDPSAKTLLMQDVIGKGVDIRVLDNGEDHKVFVDGELMVENRMTDRPKGEDNRARWGMYTPKSAMDREILLLVTGVYVGPAGGSSNKDDQDTFVGLPFSEEEESTPSTSFWDKVVDWLVPDRVRAWFDYSGRAEPVVNSSEWLSLYQQVDPEPAPEFLETYYANEDNDGYGFF